MVDRSHTPRKAAESRETVWPRPNLAAAQETTKQPTAASHARRHSYGAYIPLQLKKTKSNTYVALSLVRLLFVLSRRVVSHRASHARQPGVSRLAPPLRLPQRLLLLAPCEAEVALSSAEPSPSGASAVCPRAPGVSGAPPSSNSASLSPSMGGALALAADAPLSAAALEVFRLSLSPAAPTTLLEASMADSTSIRFVGRLAKAWGGGERNQTRGNGGSVLHALLYIKKCRN